VIAWRVVASIWCLPQCTLRFAVPEGNQTVLEAREKEHRFITPTGASQIHGPELHCVRLLSGVWISLVAMLI
jgi:hypothetical protein